MDLKRIKSKIIDTAADVENIETGKQYYKNENLILNNSANASGASDPLRTADNRIPHNFHEILVDEKASYLFTYPPQIDVDGKTNINEQVNEVLGEDFQKKLKNQCIEASNCGTSWVHYWIKDYLKEDNVTIEKQEFKYALVPTEQIIPLYGSGLEETLEGIIRHYIVKEYSEEEEKDIAYKHIEYWTNAEMTMYKLKADSDISEDNIIESNKISHSLGNIPFIEFANNSKKQSDLNKYKALVDLIDRVMSGFANDLDDIQQIIYILENYGGQNLAEFVEGVKKSKAASVDENGSIKTLQIEIPVEARKLIIEILEKRIYEAGQGLQQDVESVGQASGVALKFFYRKLELKSGLLETEFRGSINELVKAILKHLNISYTKISQTWTRNMISNDLEMAQICQQSVGIVPTDLILKYHPLADNLEEAKKLMQKEKDEQNSLFDNNYSDLGKQSSKVDGANG